MIMIYFTEHQSPLGTLTLSATDQGLCGVYFEEHKYFSGTQGWMRKDDHPQLMAAVHQLDEYFAGRRSAFELPLDLRGSAFQLAVWEALQSLPFGSTTSYQLIAQRIARPKAVRAVGTAIGRNPLSIIVPCHRVLGTSGALSGYAGGLERKQHLLALERASGQQRAS